MIESSNAMMAITTNSSINVNALLFILLLGINHLFLSPFTTDPPPRHVSTHPSLKCLLARPAASTIIYAPSPSDKQKTPFNYINDNTINIYNLPVDAHINIYNLNGTLLQKIQPSSNTITLTYLVPCIIQINSNKGHYVLKAIQ